jgi:hypothetical protein
VGRGSEFNGALKVGMDPRSLVSEEGGAALAPNADGMSLVEHTAQRLLRAHRSATPKISSTVCT